VDGGIPFGGLMQASDAKLYGLANSGGGNSAGTIFRFDVASSALVVLHTFAGTDGSSPYADLIEIPKPAAVRDLSTSTSFSVYPNPSSGMIYIKGKSLTGNNIHLKVTDALGQVVIEKDMAVANSSFTSELDMERAANGVYFITLSSSQSRVTSKFVLQH